MNKLDFNSSGRVSTIWDETKKLVKERLEYFGGNRTNTASSLGISIRTLRNYIERMHREDGFFVSAGRYQSKLPSYMREFESGYEYQGMASNEERLFHADCPETKYYRKRFGDK